MTVGTMRATAALALLCATAVGLQWQGLPPASRSLATIVVDKLARRAVMFGGGSYNNSYNDVWTLSLDTKRGYAWESLATSGSNPIARSGHTAIYDPIHNRMVVFGGRNGMTALTDVWALDLGTATWHQLVTYGTPPRGRVYISAVYDRARRSMVVFGGNDLYTGYNDVNELLLDSMKWRAIAPSGAPPEARWSYNAFYGSGDAWAERLVIFGGQTKSGQFVNDVWTLTLVPGFEAWTKLNPGGSIPEGRSNCATCFDTVARRAYFFGGFNYTRGVYYSDIYILDMLSLSWTKLNPAGRIPSERRCPAGAFDPWNRNFITFGGQTNDGFTNEWPYIYVGEASDWHDTGPNESPLLQVSSFNPRQVSIRFLASVAGYVSVKVVDQYGRVVRNLLSGTVSSGSHDLAWDGKDARGTAVSSGIYFCRVETGDMQLSKKFVLTR
jgi:hypothetical protein